MDLDWRVARNDLGELWGMEADSTPETIDERSVRRYRLARLREQMWEFDISACLLFDPVNIRYACGARNLQVFGAGSSGRSLLVVSGGPVILFEDPSCLHLAQELDTIDEIRPALPVDLATSKVALEDLDEWANETTSLLRELIVTETRIGFERTDCGAARALAERGFRPIDAREAVEIARSVKSPEEVDCIRASLRATEAAVAALREAIRPGTSEDDLWAVLHRSVVGHGGDAVEARLLGPGPKPRPGTHRTRIIEADELVVLDTDVVGRYGYHADFCRTFHAGPGRPSDEQRELYRLAYDQLHTNMSILRPDTTFREFAERAWRIPERYLAGRLRHAAHGSGMAAEYPYLHHGVDFPESGRDGVLLPGMLIRVQSHIAADGGLDGVKLAQQCLITDTGLEVLSRFPFEHDLLVG